jgi:hypothetical protein
MQPEYALTFLLKERHLQYKFDKLKYTFSSDQQHILADRVNTSRTIEAE